MEILPVDPDGDFARFRAFISYSSSDRETGRSFHIELERYKLPSSLRARAKGKRLGRIFRDRSDLSANGSLGGALKNALSQSQFLIVLCSPSAARSQWVNAEISFFAELGRLDKIIPILVAGLPCRFNEVSEQQGALPPALVDRLAGAEPFAPDLRDPVQGGDGLEMAKLKVIARLLDVPLDELTERHIAMKRADHRRTRIVTGLVSFLAIAATVGAIFAWTQKQLANQRLAEALASTAKQVAVAESLSDRYGVPSPVSQEFYDRARSDFVRIEKDVGDHPTLLAEKTRFALALAAFSRDLGRTAEREEALTAAHKNLGALLEKTESLFGVFGASGFPSEDTRLLQQSLGAANASLAKDRGEDKLAIASIHQTIEQAQTELAMSGADTWRRELARRQCDLGDIHYAFSRYGEADRAYAECLRTVTAIPDAVQSVADARLILDAVTQTGMIARAQNDPERALDSHQKVAEQAEAMAEQHAQASELMQQYAVAQGHLGDSLLGAGHDPSDAKNAYSKGQKTITTLLLTDPTRRDWQRIRFLLLERELTAVQLMFSSTARPGLPSLFDAAATLIAEMEALSERFLAMDADDAEQKFLHSVLLERRAVLALSRFNHLGDAGQLEPFEDLDHAMEIRDGIAAEAPDKVSARYNAAAMRLIAGRIHAEISKELDPSLKFLDAAASGIADLIETQKLAESKDAREVANWEYDLAYIHYLRAELFIHNAKILEAEKEIATGSTILENLVSQHGSGTRYEIALREIQALGDADGKID